MGHLLSVSMVGLTVTSSKRAYATPRTATPRAPAPAAGHCWPVPPQEMLKHSKACLVSFCGVSWLHTVLFEPSECLWQVWGLILTWFCPSYRLAGASPLSMDVGYLFLVGSNILLSMVVQQWVIFWSSHRRSWAHVLLLHHFVTLH